MKGTLMNKTDLKRLGDIREKQRQAIVDSENARNIVAIFDFLSKHLMSQQQILAESRKVYRKFPTPELAGQIKYYVHQVATIKWLMSVNAQSTTGRSSHDDSGHKQQQQQGTVPNSSLGSTSHRKVRGNSSNAGEGI